MLCEGKKEKKGNEPKERPERSAATLTSTGNESVLLQTAQAMVHGEDEGKKMRVNILFDGGSQRSYVTEELRKKLGLKGEKKETVTVTTFGIDKRISIVGS